MSMYDVDWNTLLSPTSILPPDISFRIISEDRKDEVLEAHRIVLSLLSPVFRAYLAEHGSWFNTGSQIVIRDVSWKPFRVMVDFFYKKYFDISNHFNNIEDLFEILQVADRYQVESLVKLCEKSLLSFPVDIVSVVDIVKTAMNYSKNLAPLVTISQGVIELVMDHLALKLKTAADVQNFLARSDTDNPTLEDSIKLELMKTMASRKCRHCHKFGEDKVSQGIKVTRGNMAVGAWVEVAEKSKFMHDNSRELEVGEKGKITKLTDTSYTIVWNTFGSGVKYRVIGGIQVPMKHVIKCDKCDK